MKRKIALVLVFAMLLTSCSKKDKKPKVEDSSEESSVSEVEVKWEPGEELEEHVQTQLYKEILDDNFDEENFEKAMQLEDDKVLEPDLERVYRSYSLANLFDKKYENIADSLVTGDKTLHSQLRDNDEYRVEAVVKAEDATDEKEKKETRYSFLVTEEVEEDGKKPTYFAEKKSVQEIPDFKKEFAKESFQEDLIDTELDLDNLDIYSIEQVGLFKNVFLFTDGENEKIYIHNTEYIFSVDEDEADDELKIPNIDKDWEKGFYSIEEIVEPSLETAKYLWENDLMVNEDGELVKDGEEKPKEKKETPAPQPTYTQDYYEPPAVDYTPDPTPPTPDPEPDPFPVLPPPTATPETPSGTAPSGVTAPDDDQANGQQLTNPGIPEGQEGGMVLES